MMPIKIFLVQGLFMFCLTKTLQAQQTVNTANQQVSQKAQELNAREQAVVAISAFTAQGNMTQLQKAFTDGLNAGLTVNEIKEIIVQLYAYTGFPRSLNAHPSELSLKNFKHGKD